MLTKFEEIFLLIWFLSVIPLFASIFFINSIVPLIALIVWSMIAIVFYAIQILREPFTHEKEMENNSLRHWHNTLCELTGEARKCSLSCPMLHRLEATAKGVEILLKKRGEFDPNKGKKRTVEGKT